MSAVDRIPTLVLGGTGYVAGELLRLLALHPHLELRAAVSDSKPGVRLAAAFPHLAPVYPETTFVGAVEAEELIARLPVSAVLAAAPHGVSAGLIDRLLASAAAAGTRPRVVDISADYRFADAAAYAAVYGHPHGAPARLRDFTCAVPEHLATLATPHVAHPGCFATAMLLAVVPLLKLGLIEPVFYVAGVTGSSGSGRMPVDGTHHPQRHSDLYSYSALTHRHAPEVVAIARSITGREAELHFVPHSGPFARGIHATTQARLIAPMTSGELHAALAAFYSGQQFVRVLGQAPRLKDVVASNYAQLSVSTSGRTVAVMSVLDNLTKGAAGGAVQWMNRLYGWPEATGLAAPAPGWT
ncbi:MAG TPA: N-acetyl-gamma-glutamyl-phosphate reductase [Steroidobacteraceae bacterium]|nr:N-acetyl-gamma-glutamyl-phosphate reductase [Steroidobacteraceae bacterium]